MRGTLGGPDFPAVTPVFRSCYATRKPRPAGLVGQSTLPDVVERKVERQDVASWLQGPPRRTHESGSYAGARLGLPESGPGSIASFPRRLSALMIDWLACVLIASGFTHDPLLPLGIFAVENLLLVSTLGATFGMRLTRLGVIDLSGRRLRPPGRVALRTVLLCLLVPPLVYDRDGRGLHDRAARSAVVRTR